MASGHGGIRTTYWLWFGLVLILLLLADLLTTLGAVSLVGIQHEANPLMRWLIREGWAVLIFAHIVVLCVSMLGFRAIISIGHSLEGHQQQRYRRVCAGWLSVLTVAGVLVVLNNLLLIAIAL